MQAPVLLFSEGSTVDYTLDGKLLGISVDMPKYQGTIGNAREKLRLEVADCG